MISNNCPRGFFKIETDKAVFTIRKYKLQLKDLPFRFKVKLDMDATKLANV